MSFTFTAPDRPSPAPVFTQDSPMGLPPVYTGPQLSALQRHMPRRSSPLAQRPIDSPMLSAVEERFDAVDKRVDARLTEVGNALYHELSAYQKTATQEEQAYVQASLDNQRAALEQMRNVMEAFAVSVKAELASLRTQVDALQKGSAAGRRK
ncbi:hypothetical protein FA95DRAFT_1560645 [Auriscalpium vulgare]|uniref:Uncharacterized protein n=1 Tax=Auriscalpium vulgare TaxID=40419 RepID=A0ACB8RPT4_9AGAM|nr:hypothetical protein FA95DRAFT_1560645 [Auriscalpium vulgare]